MILNFIINTAVPWFILLFLAAYFTNFKNFWIWLMIAALCLILPVNGTVLSIILLKSKSPHLAKKSLILRIARSTLGIMGIFCAIFLLIHVIFIFWDSRQMHASLYHFDNRYMVYLDETKPLNRDMLLSQENHNGHLLEITSVSQAIEYSAAFPEIRAFIQKHPYVDVKAWASESGDNYTIVWYIGYWWMRGDSKSIFYDHLRVMFKKDGWFSEPQHPYYGGS